MLLSAASFALLLHSRICANIIKKKLLRKTKSAFTFRARITADTSLMAGHDSITTSNLHTYWRCFQQPALSVCAGRPGLLMWNLRDMEETSTAGWWAWTCDLFWWYWTKKFYGSPVFETVFSVFLLSPHGLSIISPSHTFLPSAPALEEGLVWQRGRPLDSVSGTPVAVPLHSHSCLTPASLSGFHTILRHRCYFQLQSGGSALQLRRIV